MKRIILARGYHENDTIGSNPSGNWPLGFSQIEETHNLANLLSINNLIPDFIFAENDENILFTSYIFARELGHRIREVGQFPKDDNGFMNSLELITGLKNKGTNLLLTVDNQMFKEVFLYFYNHITTKNFINQPLVALEFDVEKWNETIYSKPEIKTPQNWPSPGETSQIA